MEDLFSGYSVFQRHLDYSKYIDFFIKSPKHRFLMMVLTQLRIYSIAFIVKITQKKIRMKKMYFSKYFFSKQIDQNCPKIWSFWEWKCKALALDGQSACFSSEIRTAFQAIS